MFVLIVSSLNFSCFTLFSWSFFPTLQCNEEPGSVFCMTTSQVLHSHSKIFSFPALKKARPICLSSNGKCSGTQPSKIKEIRTVSSRDYFPCLFNSWVFIIFLSILFKKLCFKGLSNTKGLIRAEALREASERSTSELCEVEQKGNSLFTAKP